MNITDQLAEALIYALGIAVPGDDPGVLTDNDLDHCVATEQWEEVAIDALRAWIHRLDVLPA